MSSINKVQLPDNTTYDIHDSRISGVDSSVTDNSQNVIKSDGVYEFAVTAEEVEDISTDIQEVAHKIKMEQLNSMLANAPKITGRRGHQSNVTRYDISHPLLNYPGAECVLVKYKNAGKKRKGYYEEAFGEYGTRKRGFVVASNESRDAYVDFLSLGFSDDIAGYINSHDISVAGRLGLAVRIPNPDYDGPGTTLKNAIYKGSAESLWSSIQPITIHLLDGEVVGIGLTI